jgi:hypothetical protein
LSYVPTEPGLYGSRYELRIDVGRIPRTDEYQTWLEDESLRSLFDVVSDVKTISYYMLADDTARASDDYDDQMEPTGGLYRRVLDRAVTKWASEKGNLVNLEEQAEQIAHEVIAVEFRYFDGVEWYEEWDSETYGGLPMLVEVAIEILPEDARQQPEQYTPSSSSSDYLWGDQVYRMFVRLPTAEVTSEYSTDTFVDPSL